METATSRQMTRLASKILCAQVLALLLTASLTGCAHPMPGDLDPTFGAGGKVITDLGGDGGISAIAIQPDGKIVAAGSASFRFSPSNFALARYNTDGSLDPVFGVGGTVITNLSGNAGAAAVAIEPDGKIVAAGYATSEDTFYDFALVRYDRDGTLDSTFGADGKVITR